MMATGMNMDNSQSSMQYPAPYTTTPYPPAAAAYFSDHYSYPHGLKADNYLTSYGGTHNISIFSGVAAGNGNGGGETSSSCAAAVVGGGGLNGQSQLHHHVQIQQSCHYQNGLATAATSFPVIARDRIAL